MKFILAAIVIILAFMFWHYTHKPKAMAKNSIEATDSFEDELPAETDRVEQMRGQNSAGSAAESLPPPPPQARSAIQIGPVNPRASKAPLPPPPKLISPKVKQAPPSR